jgi:site-specific DNA-methyltransferase (adenine-specific)
MQGDAMVALKRLPDESVTCCITSPPYWGLRDYGVKGQIGLEASVDAFIDSLVEVFEEVKRVLKKDGTLWLNIGDSYTSGGRTWRAPDKKNPARAMAVRPDTPDGLKPKELIGVPWRLAFALQKKGWFLRSDIIWYKPNAHPESVKDRPTKAHEYIFLLTKSEKYYYDYKAVRERESGTGKKERNKRTMWAVKTVGFPGAHFATFPSALIEPCIRAGTKPGDFVLDPFFGSGTVGEACNMLGRRYVGVELNPDYVGLAVNRLTTVVHVPTVLKVARISDEKLRDEAGVTVAEVASTSEGERHERAQAPNSEAACSCTEPD